MLEMLCFDICALAILDVLLFAFSFRKMSKEDIGRKLVALIIFTMIAAFSDIAANYYNGVHNRIEINYICSGIYIVMRNAAYFMYVSYIIAITGAWRISKNKIIRLIKHIPILVVIIIAVTTPFNKLYYYYGDDNMYVRGPFFGLIYVCSIIYIWYAIVYIATSIKVIGSKKALSLASCAVFSVIAAVIQFFKPYLIVDILGFTLSLLYIILFVDNPSDKIDTTSRLLKRDVYMEDLRVLFFTGKPVDIVHINVRNDDVIEQMLSYYNYNDFIRTLADKIFDLNIDGKYNAKLYYTKYGGFRAIFDADDHEKAIEFAKIAIDELNKEVSVNDMEVLVETSICITSLPSDFNIIEDLFAFGTVALQYEEVGKVVYSKDILKADTYGINSNVDKIIETGILNNRFELYYQPILDIKTGKFSEAEALIRLKDDEGNILLPEVFLKTAEQNGSIFEIGKLVMREVCSFLSSEDIKKTDIECISINLSVMQCLLKDLSKKILYTFHEFDVPIEKIRFEIRESLATDKQVEFEKNVKGLSDVGFRLTLDDYGTGYSNITTLATLPIDTIKFDRKFVNTELNDKVYDILSNSIDMAKDIGKKIIIEGIETEEKADMFKKLGCDYIQGFYYAKPMSRKKLIEFYEEKKGLISKHYALR